MFRRVVDERMNIRRAISGLLPLLLLLVLLPLSACREAGLLLVEAARVDPVVKIGLVAPFEGRHREVGYDVIYSARLAIREANQARGPGDVRLALVALDDFGDPAAARETAASLVIDPGVMAVIGHWLPDTTLAAETVYEAAGLPFIPAGEGALGATDPAALNEAFLSAYAEVTPFDEVAGPYAGTAYDGLRLIIAALEAVEDSGREIERSTVEEALATMSYDGITGTVRGQ